MAMNANYLGGAVNQVQEAPVPESAISAAHRALSEAKALSQRVNEIVDNACGPVPQLAQGSRDKTSGDLFSGLRDNAEHTLDVVRQAYSQLNRLERELSA